MAARPGPSQASKALAVGGRTDPRLGCRPDILVKVLTSPSTSSATGPTALADGSEILSMPESKICGVRHLLVALDPHTSRPTDMCRVCAGIAARTVPAIRAEITPSFIT